MGIIDAMITEFINNEIKNLTQDLISRNTIADKIFYASTDELKKRIINEEDYARKKNIDCYDDKESMHQRIKAAKSDIEKWTADGKMSKYTAQRLAEARLKRETANKYQAENNAELNILNKIHEAIIGNAILESGLASIMIEEGIQGRKFGIQEIASRITPSLTFPDSSKYFSISLLPYGKEARMALGETEKDSVVTEISVQESARNIQKRFNVHYVLVESSSAPRNDVPKSAKKPEIYICRLNGTESSIIHSEIDVMLRPEFDAKVREMMFLSLLDIYGIKKS